MQSKPTDADNVLESVGDWLAAVRYPDSLDVTHPRGTISFDTSTLTAKRWFFPRYKDGSMHEPAVSRALLNQLGPDSVFVDIGANVGFFSVLAANVCSSVHSFELDPHLASIVASHRDLNPDAAAAHVAAAAVGRETGVFVSFEPHLPSDPSTNQVHLDEAAAGYRVPTVSLDDYLARTEMSPDVLKVDVEGFEADVLAGATETLAGGNVRTLFLEVHPEQAAAFGTEMEDVLTTIREHGFTIREVVDHRGDTGELVDVDAAELRENSMLLCER